ncbi:MAG: hypothetical protein R6V04_04630 [bacterium]
MLDEKITGGIIGSAFEIYYILGYGLLGKIYQLLNELKVKEMKVGLTVNFEKEKFKFKRFFY